MKNSSDEMREYNSKSTHAVSERNWASNTFRGVRKINTQKDVLEVKLK